MNKKSKNINTKQELEQQKGKIQSDTYFGRGRRKTIMLFSGLTTERE